MGSGVPTAKNSTAKDRCPQQASVSYCQAKGLFPNVEFSCSEKWSIRRQVKYPDASMQGINLAAMQASGYLTFAAGLHSISVGAKRVPPTHRTFKIDAVSPKMQVLSVCHRHTAPPNGHASMSPWLVASRNIIGESGRYGSLYSPIKFFIFCICLSTAVMVQAQSKSSRLINAYC